MMPQMPGLPKKEIEPSAVVSEPSSPFAEDSVENSTESPVLDTPSHDENLFKKPEIENASSNDFSNVKAPITPKQGIEVVAVRKGFYNQMRYREGDKFFIRNPKEFGEWFKCVDPLHEKKRIQFINEKKAKK